MSAAIEALWTVDDVAGYLRASKSYVYKAAEKGLLPCRRVGMLLRFVPGEVRAWVEEARSGLGTLGRRR